MCVCVEAFVAPYEAKGEDIWGTYGRAFFPKREARGGKRQPPMEGRCELGQTRGMLQQATVFVDSERDPSWRRGVVMAPSGCRSVGGFLLEC